MPNDEGFTRKYPKKRGYPFRSTPFYVLEYSATSTHISKSRNLYRSGILPGRSGVLIHNLHMTSP